MSNLGNMADWMKVAARLADRLAFYRNRLGEINKIADTDPDGVRKAKKAVEKVLRYPTGQEAIPNGLWACETCGRPHDDTSETIDRQRDIMGVLASRAVGLKAEADHSPGVVRAEREGRNARRAGMPIHECPYHHPMQVTHDPMDVELGMIWRDAWMQQHEVELLKDLEKAARAYVSAGVPSNVQAGRCREAFAALDEYRAMT